MGIGFIIPFTHRSGTILVSKDLLNSLCKQGIVMSLPSTSTCNSSNSVARPALTLSAANLTYCSAIGSFIPVSIVSDSLPPWALMVQHMVVCLCKVLIMRFLRKPI